jgi:hypothetical protein
LSGLGSRFSSHRNVHFLRPKRVELLSKLGNGSIEHEQRLRPSEKGNQIVVELLKVVLVVMVTDGAWIELVKRCEIFHVISLPLDSLQIDPLIKECVHIYISPKAFFTSKLDGGCSIAPTQRQASETLVLG